jgi:hypothetical protein
MSAPKRRFVLDEAAEKKHDVLLIKGFFGYELEVDRVARVSRSVLKSDRVVEGISRFQFSQSRKTRLMHAAMTGDMDRLHFLLRFGKSVDQKT